MSIEEVVAAETVAKRVTRYAGTEGAEHEPRSQPSRRGEMRAALEEQMRRITVQDVLIQTVVTLINLGGRRLGLAGPPEQAGDKDLEQAPGRIEGVRALLPVLSRSTRSHAAARAGRALPAADGLRTASRRGRSGPTAWERLRAMARARAEIPAPAGPTSPAPGSIPPGTKYAFGCPGSVGVTGGASRPASDR